MAQIFHFAWYRSRFLFIFPIPLSKVHDVALLAYMPVQNPPGCGKNSIWQDGAKPADRSGMPVVNRTRVWVLIIGRQPSGRPESILECNQAQVVQVRTTEIDPFHSARFTFLDELPKHKRHSSDLVKLIV